jgi:hypothetical protein
VVDTPTFKAWFKVSPKKVLYGCGWKIWCPHCKGGSGRKPLWVQPSSKEKAILVYWLKKQGRYGEIPKYHKPSFGYSKFRKPYRPFSSFALGKMTPRGVEPPTPRRESLRKGEKEERMEPNVGQEAVELIAHYVGYQLDLAAIRGQEVARLREADYFKKAASLKKAWRGAISTGDGAKVIALLRERKALQEERRKTVAPLAPARREVREGLAFVTKVGFPETIARAGVEPIRHL